MLSALLMDLDSENLSEWVTDFDRATTVSVSLERTISWSRMRET
jgi:hypothetical protein